MSKPKYTLKEGYRLPIFNDGTVRMTILVEGDVGISVAVTPHGDDRAGQERSIEGARQRIQRMLDDANRGAA